MADSTTPWDCLRDARARRVERVAWSIAGRTVGAVARAALPTLAAVATPREAWRIDADAVHLEAAPGQREAVLAETNLALRAHGLVPGWRDEIYAVVETPGAAPLALIERAAARFWGTLTFGAHCNGYVTDDSGRPVALWIARRSRHKPTDPGRLDNLVGGGVPHGQTPFETLVREGYEEAGLDAATMRRATPGSVIALERDLPEGLQREHLHAHDLRLDPQCRPRNQDGEVEELMCLPVAEAIERAAAGEMTVDAALVTLDFALRHDLLEPGTQAALRARFEALRLR